MRTKYIAGCIRTQFLEIDTAIIFDEVIDHSFMARRMKFVEIHSAGFVSMTVDDDQLIIRCFGSSTSLGVQSDQKDAKLIARSLGLGSRAWRGPQKQFELI